tara:strand:- start:7619 stop:8884 length:1266 start_codon:yes stop_codon:yes gene_type:complete
VNNNTISKSWDIIFSELNILGILSSKGLFEISADEIKQISNKEPRLMCKFDNRASRPQVFKKNNISIVPIKNGVYRLLQGDCYFSLPSIKSDIEFIEWPFEKKLETLPKEPCSESQVIDIALATGLLSYFFEEDNLILTIRGRLRTPPFSFKIDNHMINVDGVQVEVDAGLEGNKIYMIEAKMGDRDDFHIRQIYYPVRMWKEKNVTKEIIPVFLTYANEVISISTFKFIDINKLDSIVLDKHKSFSFDENPVFLTMEELLNQVTNIKDIPKNIPFPQANDLRKVRDTIDLVSYGINNRNDIADFWQVDLRQADYYTNAAHYLGFLERNNKNWKLTEIANQYIHLPTTQRNIFFAKNLFSYPIFNKAARIYVNNNRILNEDFLVKVIKEYFSDKYSLNTVKRRVQTVKSWLNCISNEIGIR